MATPIVLDFGSQNCRAGFAGEDKPSEIFLSQIGVPRKNSKWAPGNYVGDILIEKKREFQLKNPIKNGYVEDIEGFASLYGHSLEKLDGSNAPVMFTEPALNPSAFREKEIQMMFEKFTTPSIFR